MCNISGILFGVSNLSREEVKGKKILEIGSYDLNGSLRPFIESLEPAEYVGIDILEGSGVDIMCNAEDLLDKFGKERFDIVVSTELLEHVLNWRKVISNIKNVCKSSGVILITTRSFGFNYHAFPYDFWRYELDDMKTIFSDCDIVSLQKDPKEAGIFIKAKKPKNFAENDLSDYLLYSIVSNKRVKEIEEKDFKSFYFWKMSSKERIKRFLFKFGKTIYSKI